jgi:hypothetical protein
MLALHSEELQKIWLGLNEGVRPVACVKVASKLTSYIRNN